MDKDFSRISQSRTVTVIIVNYNAGARLRKCLDCLDRQTFRPFETIVFDNHSTDQSLAEAIAERPSLQIIRSPENIGFAAANNYAAQSAKGDWIALLNPDAYPEPNWLEALMAATVKYPDVDAFGSMQLDAQNPERLDGAGDVCSAFGVAYRGGIGQLRQTVMGDWGCFSPCAAAALYERQTFLKLGGFDERFFCYGEDVDFGFRLRLAGGSAVQLGDAVVYHEGSGVSGRYSDFTVYHGHRNRVWLYYKNMPFAIYMMTLPLRFCADVLLFARAALRGAGIPYLRAMRDGYGGLASLNEARKASKRLQQKSGAKIAGALAWSPFRLLRRGVDLRQINQHREAPSSGSSK